MVVLHNFSIAFDLLVSRVVDLLLAILLSLLRHLKQGRLVQEVVLLGYLLEARVVADGLWFLVGEIGDSRIQIYILEAVLQLVLLLRVRY